MIWIYISIPFIAVLLLIDFLLRRKRWSANTRDEKQSLIIAGAVVPVYLFMSALGVFWGIADTTTKSALGQALFDFSEYMGAVIWLLAIAVTILALVFRKLGKARESKWVHAAMMGYFAVFFFLGWIADIL